MKWLSLLFASSSAYRMAISTSSAPKTPNASQGVYLTTNGYLSTSIQYGIDPSTGKLVSGGAGPETIQALTNIAQVFQAAGMGLNQATSCLLYIVDTANNYDVASAAYKTFFPNQPHPTRAPPGIQRLAGGALVGAHCYGYRDTRVQVVPPNFFASDFNSQGVMAGMVLYAAAQNGADPVTGIIVSGGPVNETRQALANLQTVFQTAFPDYGSLALSHLATECQLMIVGDNSTWNSVLDAFYKTFDGATAVALTTLGIDPRANSSAKVACSGTSNSKSSLQQTNLGVLGVKSVGKFTKVDASAQTGRSPATGKLMPGGVGPEITQAIQNVEEAFQWGFNAGISTTATQCVLIVNSTSLVDEAQSIYGQYVQGSDVLPSLVVIVAEVSALINASVSLQCYGAQE